MHIITTAILPIIAASNLNDLSVGSISSLIQGSGISAQRLALLALGRRDGEAVHGEKG
jgi:hypothetical protein